MGGVFGDVSPERQGRTRLRSLSHAGINQRWKTELLSSPPSYYDPDQKEKQVRQCVLLLLHKPVPPEINKETKI